MQFECQGEHFEDKWFLEKKLLFLIVFGLRATFFGTLTKKVQYGCPHCILRVQGNVLKNFVGEKHIVFFFVYEFCAKEIRTFGKRISVKLHRMNFTCPRESLEEFFLGKKTFNFIPIPDFEQKISYPRRKFPAGLSKLILTSPEEFFEFF